MVEAFIACRCGHPFSILLALEPSSAEDDGGSGMQKDAEAVKAALDALAEEGWAKQWSSMPNISRRSVCLLPAVRLQQCVDRQ